ncbi:hypothetical protein FisN_25Hu058 [Fistulifera solaris]|jgi:hypothetical protein|uniref:Uncharacterized protein n=1 Tax=Fistulifera solaris TaxID=1519565 RepID=A0A1Z5JVL8_FISSO|nr:hypothetical protein FisN_25Hu058 [Fistulifera solaris]|eukprot:GAX18083.1 hypothetical protein FisN_25Hu058 [Fistulifera solaris]
MKVISTGLLLTLGVASAQKTFMEAPEIIVYYVNELAPADICTTNELKYVDNKITPDLDMILHKKNFAETEWTISADTETRMLRGGEDRELNATCDWCRRRYPKSLCNSMYNCGFRRQLQTGTLLMDSQKAELAAALKTVCDENLAIAASRKMLRNTCGAAIAGAKCFVEFN